MQQRLNQADAENLFNDVVKHAVTSVLKPATFRKSGLNYHRRHGDTVQVVNIQVSHGSGWNEKQFYVNTGIAFDAICALTGLPVLEEPKEYECDDRGTRDRLEHLIPDAPDQWVVQHGQDTDDTIRRLQACMKGLLTELNQIGGYDEIRITFTVSDAQFQEMRHVLQEILRGYESVLELLA
jgi:hypothetical protein